MSFKQTIQAVQGARQNQTSGGEFSKVVTREINAMVQPMMERWIVTEGGGQWGRPLYRTGRLHQLMLNLPAKVELSHGVWSITYNLNLAGAMEGRVHLPDLGFQLLPTEELSLLAVHVILPHLTNLTRKGNLTLFTRLGLSALASGRGATFARPNSASVQAAARAKHKRWRTKK